MEKLRTNARELVDYALAFWRYRQPLNSGIFVIVAFDDEALFDESCNGCVHLHTANFALHPRVGVADSTSGLARHVEQQRRAKAGQPCPIHFAKKPRKPACIGGVRWTTPTHSLASVLCGGRYGK